MQYRNAPAHIRAAINEQAHRWTTTTGEPLTNVLPRYENEGKAMEEQCDRLMRECEMCGHIPSMPSIHLPSIDWRTVLLILTDARDNERFGYLDHIIDSIDNQLAEQEY